MRKLINEISTIDAWNTFYKDRIPEDVYKTAMIGTKKMTPFHKLLLDKYIQDYELFSKTYTNPEEVLKSLNSDIEYIGNAWATLIPDIKQALIEDAEDGDFDNYGVNNIALSVKRYSELKGFSEKHYASNGLRVLYESDNILVTCTTTYGANKKYYGNSHWCTASDIDGRYNGYLMFRKYTTLEDDSDEYDADLCLIQFISKKFRNNAELSFQAQYDEDGDCQYIANYDDHEVNLNTLKEKIASIGENYDNIHNLIDFKELVDETNRYRKVEERYWGRKISKKLVKFEKECIEKAKTLLNKQFRDIIELITFGNVNNEDWIDLENCINAKEGVDVYFWLYVLKFKETLNHKYYFLSFILDYKNKPNFIEEEDYETNQYYLFLLDKDYNIVKNFDDKNIMSQPEIAGNFVMYKDLNGNLKVFDTNRMDFFSVEGKNVFDKAMEVRGSNGTLFCVLPDGCDKFYIFNAVNSAPVAVSDYKFVTPFIFNGELITFKGNEKVPIKLKDLGLEALNESLNMFRKLI
jgi:hypothetical protein